MAKVDPVSPAMPSGDRDTYLERMQRGMKNNDPELAKDFAERLKKYVNEGKEINAARNEYKKVEAHTRAGGGGSGGAGGAGGGDLPPGFTPGKKGGKGFIDYKKGGKTSSASKRADGCAIRGKTKGKMV